MWNESEENNECQLKRNECVSSQFSAQQMRDSWSLTLNAAAFCGAFEAAFNALLQLPSSTFNALNPVKYSSYFVTKIIIKGIKNKFFGHWKHLFDG